MGELRKPATDESRRPRRKRSRGVRLPASSTNYAVAYAAKELSYWEWIAIAMLAYQAQVVTQVHKVAPDQPILWPGLMDCE